MQNILSTFTLLSQHQTYNVGTIFHFIFIDEETKYQRYYITCL